MPDTIIFLGLLCFPFSLILHSNAHKPYEILKHISFILFFVGILTSIILLGKTLGGVI